jgi:hypothetical protein
MDKIFNYKAMFNNLEMLKKAIFCIENVRIAFQDSKISNGLIDIYVYVKKCNSEPNIDYKNDFDKYFTYLTTVYTENEIDDKVNEFLELQKCKNIKREHKVNGHIISFNNAYAITI